MKMVKTARKIIKIANQDMETATAAEKVTLAHAWNAATAFLDMLPIHWLLRGGSDEPDYEKVSGFKKHFLSFSKLSSDETPFSEVKTNNLIRYSKKLGIIVGREIN